jgi:hypothetical protein
MLIGGSESYRAYEMLKNINWYCLQGIRGKIFETKDYREWVQELSKQSSLPRSLIKKDDGFDLAMHAGARLLDIIGRGDLFEVFKASAHETKWVNSREFYGHLDYAEYEKIWLGAEAGDSAAFLALLRYVAGASYYSAWPKEECDEHARKLSEMYQRVVRSHAIAAGVVGLEDAKRLLLMTFACFSYNADRLFWEKDWYRDDPRNQPHAPNFEDISFYKSLHEVAQGDALWRPSFSSEQNAFTDLLDVLNKVSIPNSDHSFDADFIRYQRSLMRILANDDRNCADWVEEMEEVAGRRCAIYGQVSWTNKGVPVWPEGGEDPLGLYFVSGLIRLYLGEFGLRPDIEKAKDWLLRWNLISNYPNIVQSHLTPIGGSANRLCGTSFGRDPGFMMLSDYLRSNHRKVEGYAWANAARMFGPYYGPSYQWMVGRANELTFQELIMAQRLTRKIIADLKGNYPPKYQCDRVEYLGAAGKPPDNVIYDYTFVGFDGNRFLGYFVRGLILLGIDDESVDIHPDFFYWDEYDGFCRGGSESMPTLPLDHAAALACFLKAFNFEPIVPIVGDGSDNLTMDEIDGFMGGFLSAMEKYVSEFHRLPKSVALAQDLLPMVATLPFTVAVCDLREALDSLPK